MSYNLRIEELTAGPRPFTWSLDSCLSKSNWARTRAGRGAVPD